MWAYTCTCILRHVVISSEIQDLAKIKTSFD